MFFWFDASKAAQAAGVLLDFDDGKMEYIRLLKLLYIADRESVKECGRPISYSQSVAMPYGPLSHEIYELICGERDNDQHLWSDFIRTHGNYATMTADPGRGKLSKFEIEKLREVSRRFEHVPSFEIVDKTHEFPEWQNFQPTKPNSSRRIPFTAILDALEIPPDEKQAIIADMQEKAKADRLFSGASS